MAEVVVLRLGVFDVSFRKCCRGRAPLDGVEELAKGLEDLVRFDEDEGIVLLVFDNGICVSTPSLVYCHIPSPLVKIDTRAWRSFHEPTYLPQRRNRHFHLFSPHHLPQVTGIPLLECWPIADCLTNNGGPVHRDMPHKLQSAWLFIQLMDDCRVELMVGFYEVGERVGHCGVVVHLNREAGAELI